MTDSSRRDRQLGAGYDYQWDVAAFLLLTVVARGKRPPQEELGEEFDRLGPIEAVYFEGRDADGPLEDFTLFGAGGRSLRLQIKETEEDLARGAWRSTTRAFVEFIDRINGLPGDSQRRFVFLSNGSFNGKMRVELRERIEHGKCPHVTLSTYLPATPVEGIASDGVGRAIVNELVKIGVNGAEAAYSKLTTRVRQWSIRVGGSRLSVAEVRGELLNLLGVEPVQGPLPNYVTFLRELKPGGDAGPGWSDLSSQKLWIDSAVDQAEEKLTAEGSVVLVGGRGAGKTVVARQLAYRLVERGREPLYWDFELLGELPEDPTQILRRVTARAALLGQLPLLVLENVHLNFAKFQTLLAAREVVTPGQERVAILATAREPPRKHGLPMSLTKLFVELATDERGDGLLISLLTRRIGDDQALMDRILRALPWHEYKEDFWLLELAVRAVDLQTLSIPLWQVEAELARRLEPVIDVDSLAGDVLYVVSCLGRLGLATDVAALAQMLKRPANDVWTTIRRAQAAGLMSVDATGRMCRYWHETLAKLYWDTFAVTADRWARDGRMSFGGTPP